MAGFTGIALQWVTLPGEIIPAWEETVVVKTMKKETIETSTRFIENPHLI
jgi:hypothetical protein